MVNTIDLFPRLDRGLGVPSVPVHQALIFDVLAGLQSPGTSVAELFSDDRWNQVRSSSTLHSWRQVLEELGMTSSYESATDRIDPVLDLVALGHNPDADRLLLASLTHWLAPSIRSKRSNVADDLDENPLAWVNIAFALKTD